MIKYGVGVASGVALVLAAVAWPGSASMASPVHVTSPAHQAARAAAASAPVAWVVNRSVHSATKGSVTPIDGSDYGAAITPDGSTVYVEGIFDKSTRGFIVPVCTTTGTAGKAIVFRGYPSRMAITPDGKTLYVLRAGAPEAGLPQDVIPINTATNTVGKPIETGLQPTAIAITTGQQR